MYTVAAIIQDNMNPKTKKPIKRYPRRLAMEKNDSNKESKYQKRRSLKSEPESGNGTDKKLPLRKIKKTRNTTT